MLSQWPVIKNNEVSSSHFYLSVDVLLYLCVCVCVCVQ